MHLDTLHIAISSLEDHPDTQKANYCKTELVALLANHEITDQVYVDNLMRINRALVTQILHDAKAR